MSQLENLLQQCTVKLSVPGQSGWGTGFFVAPGLILTCAHVVKKANGQPVQVRWQNQENWAEATVEKSLPDPYDLALLRVTLLTGAHPCVYLDEAVQSRDPLYLFGYPDQDFPNGCPVTAVCEGYTGDIPPLIKFSQGQVRPGMSGSPLLNQRTGKVCGIVKFTRDRSVDLGGGAIPTQVILAQFLELRELQQQWHQGDRRWIIQAVQPLEAPAIQQVNFGSENFQTQTGSENTNFFGGTHHHYNYLQNATSNLPKNYSATDSSYSVSENIKKLKEQINQPLVLPSVPNTQPFEFTVIAVDAQGKEVIRCRKQSQLLLEKLGDLELEMVVIPGGDFQMGSFEKKSPTNESPLHWVTIQSFLMSKYPITKAQWKSVAELPQSSGKLRKQPSRSGSADHPVVQISWYDAVEFCNCLSAATGQKYRLPTEAEWEYACRAGTTTPFHFGETITTNLANYDGRYPYYRSNPKGENRGKSTKVGSFPSANLFGLFDMHGNVWEWCQDSWHENYEVASAAGKVQPEHEENHSRVIRGGSWVSEALKCSSACRTFGNTHHSSKSTGFRVVRDLNI